MKKRQIILYSLAFLLLAFAVWFFFHNSSVTTMDPIPVVLPTGTPAPDDADADEDGEKGDQAVTVSVDTVQAALSTLTRAENYSRTLSVETFWSGGSHTQTIEVAARSGSIKISVTDPNEPNIKHILIAGGEKWLWYSDSDRIYRGQAAQAEADQYQTVLSYEDILSLDKSNILEACHTLYEGKMCIFVRYTTGYFGYEHHAYIDLDSGLLISLESFSGQELIYRMSSGEPELSTPDELFFIPPEG